MLKRLSLPAICLLASLAGPASAGGLSGYNPVDLTSWQPRTSQSLMALVEPLYRNHPESGEGRPTLDIQMRQDGSGTIRVDIELGGFLDDSVAGARYRAVVSRADGEWRLDQLGSQNICARGANAGEPTMDLCP